MEQRKTNKKKLVVALALLALIVVASVITTVVLVLAAGTQNVGSNVTVTYSVTDVKAQVTGTYAMRGAKSGETRLDMVWNNMNEDDDTANDGIISIIETDTTAPTMSPAAVALNSDQDYVVFAYEFENQADNGFGIQLYYTDDKDPEDKNVTFYVYSGTDAVTNFELVRDEDSSVSANWGKHNAPTTDRALLLGAASGAEGEIVCSDAKVYVYVLVKVADTSKPAVFDGGFEFVLTGKEVA